jgi:hypothetical protein
MQGLDRGNSGQTAARSKQTTKGPIFLPSLRPRKKLLIIISILFGVWAAGLVALYAIEVYPRRHPAGAATQQIGAMP